VEHNLLVYDFMSIHRVVTTIAKKFEQETMQTKPLQF